MTSLAPYSCPLCERRTERWFLYPALGASLCDDCDAALPDDDVTVRTAGAYFAISPALLAEVIERQRPLLFSSAQVDARFGRLRPGTP